MCRNSEGTGDAASSSKPSEDTTGTASADPEGRTGGPDPPGKSQVIWVSIGNKQLDPPSLEKVGPPLEP